MASKRVKALLIIAGGLLALAGLGYAMPRVVHNVMSHSGYSEDTVDLTKLSTYFTPGHYNGFINTIFYDGALTLTPKIMSPIPKINYLNRYIIWISMPFI